MKILVTGASGFVGKNLVNHLRQQNHKVIAASRSIVTERNTDQVSVDFKNHTELTEILRDIKVVIHLAARVHVMEDEVKDPLGEFRKINTLGTINLAKQAAKQGVTRFVFMSSIKVNGEMTSLAKPFQVTDTYIPTDPYGLSKYEAEQGLLQVAAETGMDVVIIRPPLVYGPNVKANFALMMEWVFKGIPLPFGAINNKRSLIALENLSDFIHHCIEHPKAANEVFLIADGEDVSTTDLLRKVAKAFGKKVWLLPIPVHLMVFVASLLGKESVADRLFGSLQIDSSKARELLAWQPVITMDEQLAIAAEEYIKNEKAL